MAMCMPMHTCVSTRVHTHTHTHTTYYSYSEMTLPGNRPLINTAKYPHRVTYFLLFHSLLKTSLYYMNRILGEGDTANETVRNITFIVYFAHKVLN